MDGPGPNESLILGGKEMPGEEKADFERRERTPALPEGCGRWEEQKSVPECAR